MTNENLAPDALDTGSRAVHITVNGSFGQHLVIRAFGDQNDSGTVMIVGHTDSMQYANTGYEGFSNWTLSANRAMAARAQWLAGSMNPESVLQVVGMADRAPLDTKNASAGVNRRIELLILTRGQADSIASMFGMAGQGGQGHELEVGAPDSATLQRLRDKLGMPAKKERADDAH